MWLKVREKLEWLFKSMVEAAGIAIFAALMVFVLVGSFVWFVLPWHQRKVQSEAERLAAEQRTEAIRKQQQADAEVRESELVEAEETVKQAAADTLKCDPVDIANDLIGGK